jgi:asparagine synthase (glutamine-hydrolysing)
MHVAAVRQIVSLVDPAANVLLNMTADEAAAAVASGDAQRVRQIDGQFAIVQQVGNLVRLARSIGRPMRYFLAKQIDGPLLVVAERIDEIRDYLASLGLAGQFHPRTDARIFLKSPHCPDPN